MTIVLPFEVGQAIWTHTIIDGQWVTTQCEVDSYSLDKYGVEVTVKYAGGSHETCFISTDGSIHISEDQVKEHFLFADRDDLICYLREEDLL